LRFLIVEQREIPLLQARDWPAGAVGHQNVELDLTGWRSRGRRTMGKFRMILIGSLLGMGVWRKKRRHNGNRGKKAQQRQGPAQHAHPTPTVARNITAAGRVAFRMTAHHNGLGAILNSV
jgi:hypothetical protein